MGVGIEDPVIPLAGRQVVDLLVVDHVIGAERAHEVQLRGAADAGHLRAARFRDLDGERAHIPRCSNDQHLVARLERPAVTPTQTLEREDRRVRQGGGVLERQVVWHQLEGLLLRSDELREGALAVREQVREDPVAGFEPGRPRPDGLDDAGDIDAHAGLPRGAQADDRAHETRPRTEAVEVGAVDRRSLDADQHLAVRGHGTFDLCDADDLGRAVALLDRSLHRSLCSGSTG